MKIVLNCSFKRFEQLCQGELSFSFVKVNCDTRQQGSVAADSLKLVWLHVKKHRFELLGSFQCENITENKEISKIYQVFANQL